MVLGPQVLSQSRQLAWTIEALPWSKAGNASRSSLLGGIQRVGAVRKPIEAPGRSLEEAGRVQPEVGADARAGHGSDALLHALLDLAGRRSVRIGAQYLDDCVSDLTGWPSKRFHTADYRRPDVLPQLPAVGPTDTAAQRAAIASLLMLMRAVVQVDLCRGPERQLRTRKTPVFPVFFGYRKLAVSRMFYEFDVDLGDAEGEPEAGRTCPTH